MQRTNLFLSVLSMTVCGHKEFVFLFLFLTPAELIVETVNSQQDSWWKCTFRCLNTKGLSMWWWSLSKFFLKFYVVMIRHILDMPVLGFFLANLWKWLSDSSIMGLWDILKRTLIWHCRDAAVSVLYANADIQHIFLCKYVDESYIEVDWYGRQRAGYVS